MQARDPAQTFILGCAPGHQQNASCHSTLVLQKSFQCQFHAHKSLLWTYGVFCGGRLKILKVEYVRRDHRSSPVLPETSQFVKGHK